MSVQFLQGLQLFSVQVVQNTVRLRQIQNTADGTDMLHLGLHKLVNFFLCVHVFLLSQAAIWYSHVSKSS